MNERYLHPLISDKTCASAWPAWRRACVGCLYQPSHTRTHPGWHENTRTLARTPGKKTALCRITPPPPFHMGCEWGTKSGQVVGRNQSQLARCQPRRLPSENENLERNKKVFPTYLNRLRQKKLTWRQRRDDNFRLLRISLTARGPSWGTKTVIFLTANNQRYDRISIPVKQCDVISITSVRVAPRHTVTTSQFVTRKETHLFKKRIF